MGAQIIRRKVGEQPEISNINGKRSQISFNSDGRIVVRYYDTQSNDTLIVLDERTSRRLRGFIRFELS